MVGDINFFIHPSDDSDLDFTPYDGEVDIMIADPRDRSRGLGRAALMAFLCYIAQNLGEIIGESSTGQTGQQGLQPGRLVRVMAKIKADNVGSIALFRNLGFEQVGEVNYFGEIKMVMKKEEMVRIGQEWMEGCTEVEYRREG